MSARIRYTTETFVEASRFKFGDKFDYTKTKYYKSQVKVTITCPKHGDFEIRPQSHLKSQTGCTHCGQELIQAGQRLTKEQFLTRSHKHHGDKYDYSLVDWSLYENSESKGTIICPLHGRFEQRLQLHARGFGCKKCGDDKIAQERMDGKDKFIAKARSVHGDKYNYDKVVYFNQKTPVRIHCPVHGYFDQIPGNHINIKKSGCPRCGGITSYQKGKKNVDT